MTISMPFKPKAQILLQLGEQLIKSESVAILELIKISLICIVEIWYMLMANLKDYLGG